MKHLLYNIMNWADFGLGTWHPEQGMSMVSNAMVELAKELGDNTHKFIGRKDSLP